MCFVKDQQVNLIKGNECMHETLIQDLSSADNDHVVGKDLLPSIARPHVCPHLATKTIDLLIKVGIQYCCLLKDERDAIHLLRGEQ